MFTLAQIKAMREVANLTYYYKLRELMADGHLEKSLATATFDSYINLKKQKSKWQNDLSLSTIISLCQRQEEDLDFPDEIVKTYSHIFNKILDSTRQLYMCYDCGTTSRAMFIALVKAHRHEGLTPLEQITIRRQYYQSDIPLSRLDDLNNYLTNPSLKKGVVMCSIGLDSLGHVFIIECLGLRHFRLYQSAHRAFTIVDSLNYDGLLDNPKLRLDWPTLYADLKHLLTLKKHKWTTDDINLFNKWFHFLDNTITPKKIKFGFTAVTYQKNIK